MAKLKSRDEFIDEMINNSLIESFKKSQEAVYKLGVPKLSRYTTEFNKHDFHTMEEYSIKDICNLLDDQAEQYEGSKLARDLHHIVDICTFKQPMTIEVALVDIIETASNNSEYTLEIRALCADLLRRLRMKPFAPEYEQV